MMRYLGDKAKHEQEEEQEKKRRSGPAAAEPTLKKRRRDGNEDKPKKQIFFRFGERGWELGCIESVCMKGVSRPKQKASSWHKVSFEKEGGAREVLVLNLQPSTQGTDWMYSEDAPTGLRRRVSSP